MSELEAAKMAHDLFDKGHGEKRYLFPGEGNRTVSYDELPPKAEVIMVGVLLPDSTFIPHIQHFGKKS